MMVVHLFAESLKANGVSGKAEVEEKGMKNREDEQTRKKKKYRRRIGVEGSDGKEREERWRIRGQ